MTLTPTWKVQDAKGDWVFGVGQEGIDKVAQGFACGRCLEEFTDTHRPSGIPTRLDACYVCGEKTAITSDFVIVPTPADWVTALKERS